MSKELILAEPLHEKRENLQGRLEGVSFCLLAAMETKASQRTIEMIKDELLRLILNSCGWQMYNQLNDLHPLDLVRLVYLFNGCNAETYVKQITAEYDPASVNGAEQQTSVP